MVSWVTEAADYKMEVEFFASHPELGEVVNWNINGIPPPCFVLSVT